MSKDFWLTCPKGAFVALQFYLVSLCFCWLVELNSWLSHKTNTQFFFPPKALFLKREILLQQSQHQDSYCTHWCQDFERGFYSSLWKSQIGSDRKLYLVIGVVRKVSCGLCLGTTSLIPIFIDCIVQMCARGIHYKIFEAYLFHSKKYYCIQ